jgi:ribosomal silencing factor RsfS
MSKKKYQQPTNLLQPGSEPEDLGLLNTIQNMETQDFSGGSVESPFAPRNYNIDFDSYDEYIGRPFSVENEDINDLRAYNQSVGEKAWYGVQKLAGKTSTAVVGGVGMLVHGLPNMLVNIAAEAIDREGHEGGYKDAFRSIFENDFQRGLDDINKWMDDKLPHYYTQEERNMSVWKQMTGGSANFWANDFVNGLSFVAGAVLTEFATAGMATAIMPARAAQFLKTVSRANQISRSTSAVGTVSKYNQLATMGKFADAGLLTRRLITGAGYEAGVEARHHYDHTMQRLEKQWREENPLKEPTIEERKYWHELAVETTNGVFVGNLALVGAGNMIAFPRIFGSGYNASKRSVGKVIKDASNDIKDRYIAAYTAMGAGRYASGMYTALKVPLYEGFVEEGGQALMDRGGQEAAMGFYADKSHPGTMKAIAGMVEGMYDNFAENYGDKHVQKEIALGFILGAMGLPSFVKTNTETGKKEAGFGWTGGVYGQFQMRSEKRKGADALAKWMNDNPSAVKAMKNNFDALNQSARANEKMDYALMTNNIHTWKNARHDHFFSYVYSRAKAGFYEDVISDINEIRNIPIAEFAQTFGYANQDLTTEELEARREKVIDKALDRAEEIRKAEKIVGTNFSQFSNEIQEMMIHQASIAKDVDARTESVRKRLEEHGANLSALEEQETEEGQQIKAFQTIAEEEGVTNKIEALVRSYVEEGADLATAYRKAFEKLGLLAPENVEAGGPRVQESEFSEASLRWQILDSTQQLEKLAKEIATLEKENTGENYTQERQDALNEMNAKFNELKRRQGRARKALEDGMQAELTPQDIQVLQEMEENDPINYNQYKEETIQDLIDLRRLRARRHSAIGLYNNLKTPQGQQEALQLVEDIVISQQQAANEAEIEDDFIRELYSKYGNGQIFEFDYTNNKGETTNYRAIFINPKQIMILPSSVAANLLSRFKYEARLRELEGQTDKKSRQEEEKIKKILDKYFPEKQTQDSVWEVSAINQDKMTNIKAVPMEEYRLELLKRAIRNVREGQVFNIDAITKEVAKKEKEINDFFEDLIDIESMQEVPGVSMMELNEQRIAIEALITEHEAAINALKEHKLNIEREARHLDTILQYYKDDTLTAKEKYDKILGISIVSSIKDEAKKIFTEFGLESDPVYGTLLADTDLETLASAIEDSEFVGTPTQDYLKEIDNAITQYERALVDIKRARDVIEQTIRRHADEAGINGAMELPIDWLVGAMSEKDAEFFKEELALNAAEQAQVRELLESKQKEAGARERATELLKTLTQLKLQQAKVIQELNMVENFMSRFFKPPAEIVKDMDENNPITQESTFENQEEHDAFYRYAPSLLNGVGFFKTAGAHQQAIDEYNRIMSLPLEERETDENKAALQFALSQQAYFKFVGDMTSPSKYLLRAVSPATPIEGIPHFSDTDIKMVIVDAYTGLPIKDKDGNLLFTSMMEPYAFMPDGSYRFAKSDFADPANPTAEEIAEVEKRVQFYADFRQGILESDTTTYFEISDKNNAIRIFEDGDYNAANSVIGRIVKDTNELKDLNVIIAKAPKGETYATINFMQRSLTGKNGLAYTIKNGQLVHLRPSTLADMSDIKDTVYNLLVQYAKNEEMYRTTNDLALKDVNKLAGSEQTIDAILRQYIYWGAQAKDRKLTQYSIYWEKGILKFGVNSMTHEQLMAPETNQDIHDELKAFLSTLNIQINRFNINDDIEARKVARDASRGKKRVKPAYKKFIQTIVDNEGKVTTKEWKNYTEFLLSERNGNQPALTTNLVEDVEYVNSKKLKPNQRITTPQFLNPYLKFHGQSVDLKKKSSKFKSKNEIPKQAGIGGLELASIEEGKTYRIHGTITGENERSYIDVPVILTTIEGVEMLQFDINAAVAQEGITDISKLIGRPTVINSVIANSQGIIAADLLAQINADFASRGQNVQMALTEIGESDPTLTPKKVSGIGSLSKVEDKKVISIEEVNLTQNEGPIVESNLDDLNDVEDDAPFLSSEYVGIPKDNYTTWDPIAEMQWYNEVMPKDSKGNFLLPLEVMKNLIDGHGYGKLTKDGRILIARDALEGAVYHEAFHGVTRLLMPTADRLALYDEVRGMRGKVTTYRGELKKMSALTDKEADEWLAEEFRKYRLANGNYKIGKGRKLSLLDKFMEWLNSVLNFLMGSSSQVQELFDRINTGGFKNATIINQNRSDNIYMSPGEASFTRAVYEGMTPAFTDIAINTRGLSFYDFYDLDLTGKDSHKLAGIYGTVEDINTDIKNAPMSVLKKLAIRSNRLKQLAQSPSEKQKVDRNWVHIKENWQTYVEGHLKYIKYFQLDVTPSSIKEENAKNDLAAQIVEKDETDPTKSMGAPLKLLLGSAPMVDKQGNAVINELGFYKPVDFYDVVGYLYRTLSNSSTEAQMIDKFTESILYKPELKSIGKRLKLTTALDSKTEDEGSVLTWGDIRMRLAFLNQFNQSNDDYLIQMMEEDGKDIYFINANVNKLESVIKREWQSTLEGKLNMEDSPFSIAENGEVILDKSIPLSYRRATQIGDKIQYDKTKTVDQWAKTPRTLQDNIGILKTFGITFSNVLKLNPQIVNTAADWILYQLSANESSVSNLFAEELDVSGRMKELIVEEARTSSLGLDLSFQNQEGKTVFGVSQKTYLNIMADKLNNMSVEELDAMQANKANLRGSYWFRQLKAGHKLKVYNLQGNRVNSIGSKGQHISKGTRGDIASIHLQTLLEGLAPFIRSADMKSEYAIGFENKSMYSMDGAVEILSHQLADEIRTSILLNSNGIGSNVLGYRDNAKDLRYFQDIVTIPAHYLSGVADDQIINDYVFTDSVRHQLAGHITAQMLELENFLKEYQFIANSKEGYINVGLSSTNLERIAELNAISYDGVHISNSLLQAYIRQATITQIINTVEMTKVLLGDLALFNPKNVFKRTKLFAGAKIYPNSGTALNTWLNENKPRKYGEHSDELISVVRNDIKITAEFIEEYVAEVTKVFGEEAGQNTREAFTNMDEFDGGGFIHLDAQRSLSLKLNEWSLQQEEAFEIVEQGQQMTPATLAYFPDLKPQYAGDFSLGQVSLKTGYKFALFPIHENMVPRNSALYNIALNMREQKIDLQVFESVTKIGAITQPDGNLLDMYTEVPMQEANTDQNIESFNGLVYNPIQESTTRQILETGLMGMQVKQDAKLKYKTTVGTQERTQIKSNLYEGGQLAPEFADLEETIDLMDQAYEAITEKGISELVAKTGLILRDGKYVFNNNDASLLNSFLIEEMESRDMSRHLTDSVTDVLARDERFMDLLMSKPKIESLLMSLAVGSTIKQKTSGSMMVQRAVSGFEVGAKAVKQKDFELNNKLPGFDMKTLRAYSKGKDGKINAMQVALPHHFKELIGTNPNINDNIFDASLFKLIGFRIPTETTASIEFIEVVGFLPEGYTSVVVPSEIVGKAGSDYDIDKLTLYFPNYEIVKGKFQKIKYLTGTAESSVLERIRKMRKTEPAAYMALVSELLPAKTRTRLEQLLRYKNTITTLTEVLKEVPTTASLIQDINRTSAFLETATSKDIIKLYESRLDELNLELISLISTTGIDFSGLTQYQDLYDALIGINEQLESIDQELLPEFSKLPLTMQNTKKALQNVVLDAHYDILSHPNNYANLLTPIGASTFKKLRDKIVALKMTRYTNRLIELTNKKNLTDKDSAELLRLKDKIAEFENKSWSKVLSFTNIVNKSSNMWSGLGGVGIGAVSAIDNVRAQQIGMQVNPEYLKSNPAAGLWFKGFDPTIFNLSRRKNNKGDLNTSTAISELMNGYVDVTADDWVFMVNAGLNFAPVWTSNLRGGLDIMTYGMFMNQPIIDEFIYQKQIKQSGFRNISRASSIKYESDNFIIEQLKRRLKAGSKAPYRLLDINELASNIGISLNNMTVDQIAIQYQVLEMLQASMELSNNLSRVHEVTAYDTNTPKDRASIKYREVLKKVMQEKNIFIDKSGNEAISSILSLPVLKGFSETTMMLPKLYQTLFAAEELQNYDQITENFVRHGIEEGISKDDIIYRLNRFENYIITEALQGSTLNDSSGTLLKSRAKYLMQGLSSLPRRVAAYKRSKDNLLLAELHPILQKHTNPKHPDYSVDNLSLRRKKLAPRDLELLGDAYLELYNTPSTHELAKEILYFSLLQSGMNFSQISIFHAIPDWILNDMAQELLTNFGTNNINWAETINGFYSNSWKDGRISTYVGRAKLRQFTGFKLDPDGALKPVGNSQKGFEEGFLGVNALSRDALRQAMTVSIPLVSNKQLAAYRKAGKSAPKSTKLFINTGTTVDNKGREVVIFSEIPKRGNGNRHIETGRGSIHTSNRVLESQFVPSTVMPLGLKTVRESIAKGDITKLILGQDLRMQAAGDGIIRTSDNAIIKLRKLGSYTRQQLDKPGVRNSLGIKSLDDLMNQAGLNSYPYYAKLFKNSNFVKTKTKGSIHIYAAEILSTGYYTAENVEFKEEASETMQKTIATEIAKKTAEQIAQTQKAIREFEEACKGKKS